MWRATVAVAVTLMLSATGCGPVADLLDPCEPGERRRLERGLAVVEASLPDGLVTDKFLNDCTSGDPPFYTLYSKGAEDPVKVLLRTEGWVPQSPEPGVASLGSDATRTMDGYKIAVSSGAYDDQGNPSMEPGKWYFAVSVEQNPLSPSPSTK